MSTLVGVGIFAIAAICVLLTIAVCKEWFYSPDVKVRRIIKANVVSVVSLGARKSASTYFRWVLFFSWSEITAQVTLGKSLWSAP